MKYDVIKIPCIQHYTLNTANESSGFTSCKTGSDKRLRRVFLTCKTGLSVNLISDVPESQLIISFGVNHFGILTHAEIHCASIVSYRYFIPIFL